ncbi:MAG TPA: NAD(P)/FAD-dependent oxidoreductase [Vicinamibacteria bacterium]
MAVAVVGAGAAGLMAAIEAARRGAEVVALDGARTLGAKILVSGGGRCNVTHHAVDETAFAGSTRPAIRKVLRRFDVEQTVRFFAGLGVTLRREETGKLFPATDRARTVLDALLRAARDAGVGVRHPWRVQAIERVAGGFSLRSAAGETLAAARVVLATGGRSLPKTGSDGHGYVLARALGHTITSRVFPALVPLTLPRGHPLCALAGLSVPARLEVRGGSGRALVRLEGSLLCTHFGLSGPVVLDVSRYWTDARADDAHVELVACWLPDRTPDSLDADLRALGGATVGGLLERWLPERLSRTLCELAAVEPAQRGHRLTREQRAALVRTLLAMPLPVTGDRGFDHAEVTAGGVPLSEVQLETMESRRCPGLFLCGEICDVDGRIGGFNFQWAWASGYVAGVAAATSPR